MIGEKHTIGRNVETHKNKSTKHDLLISFPHSGSKNVCPNQPPIYNSLTERKANVSTHFLLSRLGAVKQQDSRTFTRAE
jgi:hypothetical protein